MYKFRDKILATCQNILMSQNFLTRQNFFWHAKTFWHVKTFSNMPKPFLTYQNLFWHTKTFLTYQNFFWHTKTFSDIPKLFLTYQKLYNTPVPFSSILHNCPCHFSSPTFSLTLACMSLRLYVLYTPVPRWCAWAAIATWFRISEYQHDSSVRFRRDLNVWSIRAIITRSSQFDKPRITLIGILTDFWNFASRELRAYPYHIASLPAGQLCIAHRTSHFVIARTSHFGIRDHVRVRG